MKYKNYAKEFTKQELINQGFEIRFDEHELPHVFQRNKGEYKEVELKLHCNNGSRFTYLAFMMIDYDEDGKRQIMRAKPNWKNQNKGYYVYRYKTVLLHRAIWAWVYGEVP